MGSIAVRDPVTNFSRAKAGILSQSDMSGIVGGYRDWRDVYFENVEAQGGAVHILPYLSNRSTTGLLEQIRGERQVTANAAGRPS